MTLTQLKRPLRLLSLFLVLTLAAPDAFAQFIPYFGKNKVNYDKFAWRVYKSPHFEVYYYPEFEQHLGRLVSYLESAYQHVASELKHEIQSSIPVVFYKTHSEFEETNLFPDFVPDAVQAFTEPIRNRMVIPVDGPPDRLQGLITHELTHVFEFDLIPRGIVSRGIPLWVDEGLADYMRDEWDSHDLMTVRDAALSAVVLARRVLRPYAVAAVNGSQGLAVVRYRTFIFTGSPWACCWSRVYWFRICS